MPESKTNNFPYRLDRLPVIMPYHFRARNLLNVGDLVYYGPAPEYYGIGEVLRLIERWCVVDFRGTGDLKVYKDVMSNRYLIPIHNYNFSHLILDR